MVRRELLNASEITRTQLSHTEGFEVGFRKYHLYVRNIIKKSQIHEMFNVILSAKHTEFSNTFVMNGKPQVTFLYAIIDVTRGISKANIIIDISNKMLSELILFEIYDSVTQTVGQQIRSILLFAYLEPECNVTC